jgi:hypothetical protein
MDEDNTTYPEYRNAPIARYGRLRIDRTWIRFPPAEVQEFLPELVLEIDASSEFDLMAWTMYGGASLLRRLKAGEAITTSEVRRIVTWWIGRMRPIPGGGLVSLACYRRRIGPPDAQHEGTPGEWYIGHNFRRPGRPLIDMHEAVPLVEAALRELEETETNTAG